ncbi:unnamed protein product [Closterium sp. NIES-64]|nr:unnamed protein product [Closterium sp. NIES-65]CAI5970901.1 unnamed protein product [Closterium sp. NIES-65]CAI5972070.1 unnamed protein product [Closterium sp. NIES-64]
MQAAAAAGSVLKGIAGLTQSPATTVASPGGSKSTVGSAASAIAGAAGPVSGVVATSGIGFGAAIGSAPSSIRGFSSGSNTQQMTEEAAAREEAAASADGAVAGLAVAAKEGAAAAEEEEKPQEIFLANYKPPSYLFDKVSLDFDLHDDYTLVKSTIAVVANDKAEKPENESAPLVLDGHDLELVSLQINGVDVPAEEYVKTGKKLTLLSPPASPFTLAIVTRINPAANTSLEGLYRSSGNFCTQCEAEGFRRITYYQDRPDVMSRFTVRMEADRSACPVLLSNGNQIDSGVLGEGEGARHYAVWEDPWPKPCYLFALVAGKLVCCEDKFVTCSGREVALRIWVNAGDEGRTAHAMKSLKESFRWDEEVFGREYDLDLFNVVAVPDFNMGAMENKSLNIFNSRLVLASPETATDGDYAAIEGVIAHEYFHNWTGNRVTCRDWFQLTLKEGLTVFRDQEFSSDMNCRAVERIANVAVLRARQFSEDAGPMAHPVRPSSYIKMDNFYTVTVYEKGAEVVKMYQTLLGKDGFRKGMDLYFERHDGQAVTCDDFFAAMADANNDKLEGFKPWLSQAGTPVVTVTSSYNDKDHTFTLHCKQEIPATPGQDSKLPVLIPLAVGLVGPDGKDMPLLHVFDGEKLTDLDGPTTTVLRFNKAEQDFTFTDVPHRPVPSLLRGFSAPVRLNADLSHADWLFLLANDSDEFNRWEACQVLARKMLLRMVDDYRSNKPLHMEDDFTDALAKILDDTSLDKMFIARVISLPGESEIADLMTPYADPDAVHAVRKFCVKQIATRLRPTLEALVESNRAPEGEAYSPEHASMARRSLKNAALLYLASLDDEASGALALSEFRAASNMTDQFAALAALCLNPGAAREEALQAFYEQWKHDGLVMNKWLSLQAASSIPGNVEAVKKLMEHPAFIITEPNKVYSLIGGFNSCAVNLHAADGSGYRFLADVVLQLDKINAQVAARMVSAFTRWRRYDEARQALAKVELERILSAEGLSENVYEIVSKSLSAPPASS